MLVQHGVKVPKSSSLGALATRERRGPGLRPVDEPLQVGKVTSADPLQDPARQPRGTMVRCVAHQLGYSIFPEDAGATQSAERAGRVPPLAFRTCDLGPPSVRDVETRAIALAVTRLCLSLRGEAFQHLLRP